jgi:hypothetical protein
VLIFLILFSIFILYTQTITNLTLYGENSKICGSVLERYCSDKFDNTKDPGCYVTDASGTPSSSRMLFHCTDSNCFKYGSNFGSIGTNTTCSNLANPPFQDLEELDNYYGKPYLFTSRQKMHHLSPICTRIECIDNSDSYTDVRVLWIVAEFLTNIIFTIEWVLRIYVAESVWTYLYDLMNFFDVLSIVPFYVELFRTLLYSSFENLNFSILASSPVPIFFVTLRSLKVTKTFFFHFVAYFFVPYTNYTLWCVSSCRVVT